MSESQGIFMGALTTMPPLDPDEVGYRPEDFEPTWMEEGFRIRHLPDLSTCSIGFVIDFAHKVSLVHQDGGLEPVLTSQAGNGVVRGLGATALFHTGLYAALWWLRANGIPPQWLPREIKVRTDLATNQIGGTGRTWTFHRVSADESRFLEGARYAENVPVAYIHISGQDALSPNSDTNLRLRDEKAVFETGTNEAVGALCARYHITPEIYFSMARQVMEQILSMPKGYRCIITNNHGEECSEVGVGQ